MPHSHLFIYADGASRGNPGDSGIGVVLLDENKKKIKEFYKYLGQATNNIAEYNALIYGLQEALILGAKNITIRIDSELVTKQLKGEYKVKNANIKPLFEQALHILNGFDKINIEHIDRSQNKDADKLANKAINLKDSARQIG